MSLDTPAFIGADRSSQCAAARQPTPRLDGPTEHEAVRLGQEAWTRLRENQSWHDWLRVGAAHMIGRAEAMRAVHTNRPAGSAYNAEFGAWLERYGFNALNKGDRSRLFEVMDNLPAIEAWRETLPLSNRLQLNHPTSVLRKWRSATRVDDPNIPKRPSPQAQLKAAHVEVLQKLHRAEQEIKRGGGDLWTPEDRAEDIAEVMMKKLSPRKAEAVARALLRALKAARAAA